MYRKKYALATGELGAARLEALNSVCNPHTIEFLTKNCFSLKDKTVLDVGCGIGIMTQILADLVGPNGRVVALDNSAAQLKVAKKNLRSDIKHVEFIQNSVDDLKNLNEEFDLIYGRFIYIHLQNPFVVVKRLMAFLKAGGIFVCEESANMDVMFAKPDTNAFKMWKNAAYFQMQHYNCDATIGMKLYPFFREQGYLIKNINLVQPLLTNEYEKNQLWQGIIECAELLESTQQFKEKSLQKLIDELQVMSTDSNTVVGLYQYMQIAAQKLSYTLKCMPILSLAIIQDTIKDTFIRVLTENVYSAGEKSNLNDAEAYAIKRFNALLGEEKDLTMHHLFSIKHTNNQVTGYMWVKRINKNKDSIPTARIVLLNIAEKYQRQNFGFSALKWLEECPELSDIQHFEARVYVHNKPAFFLLIKLGFSPDNAASTEHWTLFKKTRSLAIDAVVQ